MSGKKKLAQFAEMKTFKNVLQVPFDEVFKKEHRLKGFWKKEIFGNENPIILELGCGKGEYTVGLARKYPGKNFIGVDIKGARMWRGAKTALEEKIENVHFLRSRIDFIDSFFGHEEVEEIWITFPDPQLRESREKKRLTSPRFLNKYLSFLDRNGVIHLKTDSQELYSYSMEISKEMPFSVELSTDDLDKNLRTFNIPEIEKEILNIPTFYESMFREQGKPICYLRMRRIQDE